MHNFYEDNEGRKYEKIESKHHGGKEQIMDVIDQLFEKKQMQEVIESEISKNNISFEQEIPFKDGFRVGMAFMFWLYSTNKIKSLAVDIKGKHKKGSSFKRKLAKLFSITPIDLIEDD